LGLVGWDLHTPGEQPDQRQQREASEQQEGVAVPDPIDRKAGDHRPEKARSRKSKRKQAEIHGAVLRLAHPARHVVDRDMKQHELSRPGSSQKQHVSRGTRKATQCRR
jgi:hypothetical protein